MDWNKIFMELTTKANNGDADAMTKLHDHYWNDKDLLQNFDDNLVAFYESNVGPYSLYQLGIMHFFGMGYEKDINVGVEYIKKSLAAGCSQAFVYMAVMVRECVIKDLNYDELVDKAIVMGNFNGYIERGMANNDVKLLQKAADMGSSYALHKVGEYYHDLEDYKNAKKYYLKAIKHNVNHSYYNLGIMNLYGEGCKKNDDKAMKLFVKAKEFGNNRLHKKRYKLIYIL